MTPSVVSQTLLHKSAQPTTLEQSVQKGAAKGIKPVFETNDFCLYKDDCLKVLAEVRDNFVDMIFADPPYMLSNGGVTCYAGKMVSVNKGKWEVVI